MNAAHYRRVNRDRWNELTGIHARSAFYDLESFRRGKNSLRAIELEELGAVSGKSLLHLQCHFGQDTLSWARLGATTTGVDFSEQAIELARSLCSELGLQAKFLCSDLYDLPQVLSGQFDIVFTSYGILCWLPDLKEWARIIARFLKPGGIFYMAEIHPFAYVFEDDKHCADLRVVYSYFHSAEPFQAESDGSYADRSAQVQHRLEYVWFHSLSDVLNALIAASLRIEFLHEFPFCACGLLPCM